MGILCSNTRKGLSPQPPSSEQKELGKCIDQINRMIAEVGQKKISYLYIPFLLSLKAENNSREEGFESLSEFCFEQVIRTFEIEHFIESSEYNKVSD